MIIENAMNIKDMTEWDLVFWKTVKNVKLFKSNSFKAIDSWRVLSILFREYWSGQWRDSGSAPIVSNVLHQWFRVYLNYIYIIVIIVKYLTQLLENAFK